MSDRLAVPKYKAPEMVGVSLRTWYRLEALGKTPPLIQLSDSRTGYLVSDLKAWLEARRIVPATP
jgi:predicted DNA-binding transcriptional regulator AlpA